MISEFLFLFRMLWLVTNAWHKTKLRVQISIKVWCSVILDSISRLPQSELHKELFQKGMKEVSPNSVKIMLIVMHVVCSRLRTFGGQLCSFEKRIHCTIGD